MRTTSPPRFCRANSRPASASTRQGPFDVHALQPPKRLQVHLDQRAGQGDPGIEHHDIDAAPVRDDLRERAGDGRGVSDIHRHADGAGGVACLKLRHKLVELLAGQIGDGDVTAVFEQPPANPIADRARRAGDDSDSPGQPRVVAGCGRGIDDLEDSHVGQ